MSGCSSVFPVNRLPLTAYRCTFCPCPHSSSSECSGCSLQLDRRHPPDHSPAPRPSGTPSGAHGSPSSPSGRIVPLLSHNPHVDRIIGLAPGRLAAQARERASSGSLSPTCSICTRTCGAGPFARWCPAVGARIPKHRIARALLIRAKRNRYHDRRPVPERYFSAASHLDVSPDGAPPEFFLGPEAEQMAAAWLGAVGAIGRSTADRGCTRSRTRDQALAGRALASAGEPDCCRRVQRSDRRGARRRETGGFPRRLRTWLRGKRCRSVRPPGNRRSSSAVCGSDFGGHRRDAHGDSRRHPGRGAVWPDGRSLRLLPLHAPFHRPGDAVVLPPVQQSGRAALSAGPPPVHARDSAWPGLRLG